MDSIANHICESVFKDSPVAESIEASIESVSYGKKKKKPVKIVSTSSWQNLCGLIKQQEYNDG